LLPIASEVLPIASDVFPEVYGGVWIHVIVLCVTVLNLCSLYDLFIEFPLAKTNYDIN